MFDNEAFVFPENIGENMGIDVQRTPMERRA